MKRLMFSICLVCLVIIVSACSNNEKTVDAGDPITINVWHYYNGDVKYQFDKLVDLFNQTAGAENGVIVEVKSYGGIGQLESALFSAAKGDIGSQSMPDIFAAYPEQAYRLSKETKIVPLEDYFTKDELATYYPEFLEEGQILHDGKTYILPIAKSTENLFINKTAWEPFAKKNNFTKEDLSTWKGINHVAEVYYNQTGKAFLNHNSFANFMFVFAKQLGGQFFLVDNDGVSFTLTEDMAEQIWKQFYVPYLKGYYSKTGHYSLDDLKTGKVIAIISTTTTAGFFPNKVANNEESYEIETLVLPYPIVQNGKKIAVKQGAGMVISASDDAQEYGSALFLKWFTENKHNLKMSLKSGYLPVKKDMFEYDKLLKKLSTYGIEKEAIVESFNVTYDMLEDYSLYSGKPYDNSYNMRGLIGSHLYDKVMNDRKQLEERINQGEDKAAVIEELTSDKAFLKWYEDFSDDIHQLLP